MDSHLLFSFFLGRPTGSGRRRQPQIGGYLLFLGNRNGGEIETGTQLEIETGTQLVLARPEIETGTQLVLARPDDMTFTKLAGKFRQIPGRVERWRGGVGFGIILFRGFPVRVSLAACRAPFPPPAHRTGRADFPHPALGQGSCFRPRVATGKFADVQQPELTLQIVFGILAVSLPIPLKPPTQPPTDPTTNVRMHDLVCRGVGSVAEVIGPPAQHLIDLVDQRFRSDERR